MKHIYTTVLLCLTGLSFAQSLSFPEALERMRGANQKLKGMEKQTEAALYGEKNYKGLYLPQLSINASYVHLSEPLSLSFNKYKEPVQSQLQSQLGQMVGSLPPPMRPRLAPILTGMATRLQPLFAQDWSYQFQEQDIWKLSADLRWVLFAGGKVRVGNKVSQINHEIAKVESQKTENALISELAERYFQVQLAQQALLVRQKALQTAEQHYSNAQKLEKNGMVAPIETMQAKKAVTDAQREVLACQKDIELAQTALSGVIGEQVFSLSSLTSPLFEVAPLRALDYYQGLAKQNFPAIQQAYLKKELTEQNIKAQRAAYLPDVALIGKKYLWSKNLPLTEPDNWVVGVGLQWNIFNGFSDKNKIAQAKAQQESVEQLTAQAEKDVQTLVKKYYTEIEKQREQLQSLQESLEFARELVRVRNQAFSEGLSSSTDVADASLYLASIEIKGYQALFEMDKVLALLLETCGLSTEYTDYMKK
nr:TolC family protein [uncultured Capnocytophaga sp.]